MDAVFKALGDPTRRRLLDTLRDRGGLTLTELEAGLGMTRFGVMKHLKVLEAANLVVTRRDGRFKYHYLNALPIQEVADSWMAPYGKPLARFALDLKNDLEGRRDMASKSDFVLQTYIRTTQDALWDALINPSKTAQYYYSSRIETDLKPGGPFRYRDADGSVMVDGVVVEVTPKTRIVSTFIPTWVEGSATTKVIFEIEPMGEVCKFTLTHENAAASKSGAENGWPLIAAGLKTLLETGKPLNVPEMQ
ncbi:MAG: metalloregulator ArsR/SmtB family transcription factor [Devosia sp.]